MKGPEKSYNCSQRIPWVNCTILHMCNTDLSCYTMNQQNSNTKFAEALSWHWFCNFTHLHEELRVSNSCHLLVHRSVCGVWLCSCLVSIVRLNVTLWDRQKQWERNSESDCDWWFIHNKIRNLCLHFRSTQTRIKQMETVRVGARNINFTKGLQYYLIIFSLSPQVS